MLTSKTETQLKVKSRLSLEMDVCNIDRSAGRSVGLTRKLARYKAANFGVIFTAASERTNRAYDGGSETNKLDR